MYEHLGLDLSLGIYADEEGRSVAGPFSRLDLQPLRRQDVWPREADVAVASGLSNLVQGLLLRLKTEKGELAALGYPDYGSRHHSLVGEPNTESTRNLMKLHVLECLRQEPRIEKVLKLVVRPGPGRQDRDKVDIELSLKAAGISTPLNLVVPFSLAEAVS
jgi:phage baseplate assembly protein W